jgi:spore maturation protein CgeB
VPRIPEINTPRSTSHPETILTSHHPRKRRILYVGNPRPGQTSAYRMESLRRLAQDVVVFDVPAHLEGPKLVGVLRSRFPEGPLVSRINRQLLHAVDEHQPDVVFFDKPIYFTRSTIEAIKRRRALTVSYNQDNPFGPRKDGVWRQFYKVFRLFDLHCLFRKADVARYQAWGLNFIETMFSFDPVMQFPPPVGWSDTNRTREVSYIGSPLEDRPQFLRDLAERHQVPISISGPRWEKFFSDELRSRYVTHGYLKDSEYRESIWKSKINLGFITHKNEDDIGHKSIEIAACQSFLLAVRSGGQAACFEEDQEAVFFSSLEECADKSRFYLDRPDLRQAIALRARARVVRSGYDNDSQLARILNKLDGQEPAKT